ncbi:hypothetical protein PUN28_019936 [Cardiocondyla obscurior]|uniref:Transmembrane protein n=1 Tax=Cardiocondyla obscurior TaxID=286306 RepID=A0AAW2EC21_9HYME
MRDKGGDEKEKKKIAAPANYVIFPALRRQESFPVIFLSFLLFLFSFFVFYSNLEVAARRFDETATLFEEHRPTRIFLSRSIANSLRDFVEEQEDLQKELGEKKERKKKEKREKIKAEKKEIELPRKKMIPSSSFAGLTFAARPVSIIFLSIRSRSRIALLNAKVQDIRFLIKTRLKSRSLSVDEARPRTWKSPYVPSKNHLSCEGPAGPCSIGD